MDKNLCLSCETGYYPIYDDLYMNNSPYINCSKSPKGYYLDEENSVYKKCYSSCKKCNTSGNESVHQCLECRNNYNFEIHYGSYKNCFNNCSFYHYFDEDKNISFCTQSFECPLNYDI